MTQPPINSNNKSDYNTQSTDLFNLLPQPYKSDTNRSVMSNLFNRYLSKDETTQVIGYIGDGNPNAVFIRKIVEPTVHRAGWQLQPLLYTKIGSIEYITSWYDILDELTAQGVNIDNLPVWGNATVYNWAPPIDINKIVNYQDYYWYDTDNPNSQPQYITVKSVCAQATALVTFFQRLIDQFGANFPITQVLPSVNGLAVVGNRTQLFSPGFVFFINNSPNAQLNNTFQTAVSSSYNSSTGLTTIVIETPIVDTTVGGQITLEEQLHLYQNLQACECANSSGWDVQPWDDNQTNQPPPIWNTAVLADISFPTLANWNAAHPTPELNDIWYDTTGNTLWSLQDPTGASNILNWKAVYNNFNLVLMQTTGTAYWDLSTGCSGSASTIPGMNQWISQNKWVHKSDVTNFTTAKRAQAPIIEFEPQLELNEWTYTTYNWQYRPTTLVGFTSVDVQPIRFELEPVNAYMYAGSTFILDERFGDMTSTFIPGYGFTVAGFNTPYVVESSTYQRSSLPSGAFETRVVVTTPILGSPVPSVNWLQPENTSLGNSFQGYDQQWQFMGINTTVAVNHQAPNNMDDPSGEPVVADISGNYTYQVSPYAEQFNMLVNGVSTLMLSTTTPPGSSRSLQERALVGFDDIRVYVNGVRQYGSYDEVGTTYVTGITLHTALRASDVVVVCVGEATFEDFGNYAIEVRTPTGNALVSLIQYRKVEQIKTAVNQYPLFDIYLTNSDTANIANRIFSYHDDPSGVLYPYLSERVVTRPDGSLEFTNQLVQTNNGLMYAYRNYNKSQNLYWFDQTTQILYVWTGETWATKYEASGYYTTPQVLSELPDPLTTPLGFLVFNTTDNTLYQRTNTPSYWTVEISVAISTTDQTLQTVWRHGLNNEQAVPAHQDWLRRSYPEYEEQHDTFVTDATEQLLITNPSWTEAQAELVADEQWTEIQLRSINPAWYDVEGTVSQGPLWCGQWQIPDPMYYNVSHYNYQYVSTRDLLSHFQGIVDAQPLYPGFTGQPSANWNLIAYTDINWGLGGTIHEYDNSFDTFLSAEYTNIVTPATLFNFAQSEYENIIVTLGQVFQRNAVSLLTKVDTTTILTPQITASDFVLESYEENEAANLVYGDSTTFTQATATTPEKGIRNWIATLPYFGIIPKEAPSLDYDTERGINALVHHDGHRASYSIPPITEDGLQTQIANTVDPRFPTENLGRISLNPPPATQAAFITNFSTNLRTGVYWLQSNANLLYRMVAFVQIAAPPTSYPDGTYWWNTSGSGTLNILENGAWISLGASLTPAWQVVDLSKIYAQVILSAEELLYENVPPAPLTPPIDFAALEASDPAVWNQMLQQQFNNYVREKQITTPFANSLFDQTNPFTWNYKYSTTSQPPRAGVIESGGAWQDVYQKTYYTPYPHLEPWMLQGYDSQPSWWDDTFLNNDPLIYGNRRWKYLHNVEIHSAATNVIAFGPFGDNLLQKVFQDFNQFTVHNGSGSFTYDVASVFFGLDPNTGDPGYTVVTTTTPLDVSIVSGDTATVGMWDYVVRGAIANNEVPPTVPVPSYSYVSVNISSTETFIDGAYTYGPDDVFPPYWNVFAHLFQLTLPQDSYIRSLFTDTNVEVLSENADYKFGDSGPVEWQWRNSTYYTYSLLTMSYLLQPVRTIQAIFGIDFEYIDGLPIDSLTGKVFSHTDTQFHGEISTSNQLIKVDGINQWYINYLRQSGFDTSYSDFRAMWTTWIAPLSHQFDSTIDTSSFQIDHRLIDISSSDYELTMKKSPAVSNAWIDTFNVQVVSMPPIQSLYDTESQWILSVDTLAPISRTVSYYDVKLYDYYVDPATSTCSLFTYPVVAASMIESSFVVNGDVSAIFGGSNGAEQFTITGSAGNNGTYTVVSATFDPVSQQTTIVVSTPVPSMIAGGLLTAINYRTLPWVTGDVVSVATTEIAPLPLEISKQYFIIKLSPTTFKLALTKLHATANIPIVFTSPAYGLQRVGELYNTFTALNGRNTPVVWNHYSIDKSIVKTFTTPYQLTGMQNWINIYDGYVAYIADQGFGVNVDGTYTDPQTGAQVGWQNEMERFINWSYQQRSVRRQRINDKYPVNVDYANSQFTYTSQNPQFVTGSPVVVWAFGGGLPTPLMNGQSYYVFYNTNGTVSLASTRTNALSNIPIQINYVGSVGQLYLSAAALYLAEIPTYELNPIRNALWYSPPNGVVSNVVTGPFADITTQQLLFDQYGRKLAPGDIRVFRQDKITQIQFAGGVYNDIIAMNNQQQNPYLYLHLGGGNIFVDTYEHVILFDNYTSHGALIYDPFLGVNVTKFELDYYRQSIITERPNVGGYFLSTDYNQGANLIRNLEATVTDLRYAYDTYQVPETLQLVQRARATLDYPGSVAYLKDINLTPKSQFLFWNGMLHAKGSVNAITAFVNSRLFVSANIDQFWAYEVAEFGSSAEKEYLSLLLQSNDTISNELRLEFISTQEICAPGYAVQTFGDENCGYAYPETGTEVVFNTDPGFTPIVSTDQSRWWNQPDQAEALQKDGGTLFFNLEPKQKLVVYPVVVGPTTFIPYGPSVTTDPNSPLYQANLTDEVAVIAYDPPNTSLQPSQQYPYTFWYWNTANNGFWEFGGGWDPVDQLPTLRHNFMADNVQLTMSWYSPGFTTTYSIPSGPDVKELTISPYLPLSNSLSVYEDGIQLQPGADYVESLELAPGSTVLGNKLYFQESIDGSTLKIVYGPSQLNSETQFQIKNTNILQLLSQEFITQMFTNNFTLTMWGLEVDKEAQNPAKIIDQKAQVVLSPVSFWDPARGYQYYEALHSIDIQTNEDPAIYDTLTGWKNQEVGKTWLDTTNVAYKPYFDPYAIEDQDERFTQWGQLTDYGNPRIFQWVASPVAPEDYNELAEAQENDSSINPAIRLSGTARQDVRSRTRSNTDVSVISATNGNTVIQLTNPAVLTDLTGLAPGGVTPVDPSYTVTITVDGNARTIELQGSTIGTYGDLITQLNGQLSSVGATANLIGNDIVITSNSSGPSSTLVISADTMFSSLTEYNSLSGSTSGANATSGTQSVTLPLPAKTANSATGLVYTPATSDPQYTVSVATVGLNMPGPSPDPDRRLLEQQAWSSTNETRTALGSQLVSFADIVAFFQETFTNVTTTIDSGTNILLTSKVACVRLFDTDQDQTFPSIVTIQNDSFLNRIPDFVSITSTESTTPGFFGTALISFSSAFADSGLGPDPEVDTSYSFNIAVDQNVNRVISIQASEAQTYGQLVYAINNQLSSLGAGVTLEAQALVFSSDSTGVDSTIELDPVDQTLFTGLGATINAATPGAFATSGTQSVLTNVLTGLYNDLITGLAPNTSTTLPSYTFTINVNGTFTRTLTYLANQVTTFNEMITLLSRQFAVYGATIVLNDSQIIITSNMVGLGSSITITEPGVGGLFNSITTSNGGVTNFALNIPTPGGNQVLSATSMLNFVVGETVLFSSSDTLPEGLESGTAYTIQSIAGNTFALSDATITSPGTGTLLMVSSTFPSTWVIDEQISTNVDPLIDAISSITVDDITTYTFDLANCVDPTQDYATPLFVAGDTVNVYVNGIFVQTYTLTTGTNLLSLVMDQADRATIILPIHVPTEEELAFDPSVEDDGSVVTQWQFITNYNAVQTFNTQTNQQQFTYYFWVENVTTVPINSTREAPVNAVDDLITPPQPYMFFNKLIPPATILNPQTGQSVLLPDRFVQAIVRGLRGYVDSNDRYVLRFTRDFTLRDNLAFGTSPLQLKDKHEEWLMFRQKQLNNISRDLWDKITESMVGYLLNDPSVRVPALNRQLYDTIYNAQTQYGLGEDQAFVDGVLAKATILAYLNDPANDFYPVSLDDFFTVYNFDTPENIIVAMNAIYTTFGYTNVNNIFFSVLQDALTTQLQYAGLMKTSAIALYGVQLLNVSGVYDD